MFDIVCFLICFNLNPFHPQKAFPASIEKYDDQNKIEKLSLRIIISHWRILKLECTYTEHVEDGHCQKFDKKSLYTICSNENLLHTELQNLNMPPALNHNAPPTTSDKPNADS